MSKIGRFALPRVPLGNQVERFISIFRDRRWMKARLVFGHSSDKGDSECKPAVFWQLRPPITHVDANPALFGGHELAERAIRAAGRSSGLRHGAAQREGCPGLRCSIRGRNPGEPDKVGSYAPYCS
ncbi:hypothetical protein [Berryella intestinalis]|uniref:hypothetical protein n=1 Tax=Berryella intestinalis TaxID=1531429 RepID=UPI0011848783|nr:hypothetical protein [Berryella intestinalis]